MNGAELAILVQDKYGTRNVFEIAEKVGLSIVYGKWSPVTWGELDRRNKTMMINENAQISFERIIAHELGHYFLDEFGLPKSKETEIICDEFAAKLLNDE